MEDFILYKKCDYDKIKKTIINYTIIIFGLIFILIFILLGLYYLSPNNYIILKWEDKKYKLENTIEYIIKSDSNLFIDLQTNNCKYLRFSEPTNLIIKNSFKSQTIDVDKNNDLIKSKYNSEIFIINNSKVEKKITIQFYSII